ncbi:hypothetical protein BH20VER1_BH20VER1_28430 [soil metagenome]
MAVDYTRFGGWENNLRLHNEHAELIVTLDVGPRVISYRTIDGANVFKTFEEQLGGTGESEWKSRGGHRFWLAPEHEVLSYIPDNATVEHRIISEHEVEIATPPAEQLPIRRLHGSHGAVAVVQRGVRACARDRRRYRRMDRSVSVTRWTRQLSLVCARTHPVHLAAHARQRRYCRL